MSTTTLETPVESAVKMGVKTVVTVNENGVITPAGTVLLNHSDRCDRCGGRAYVRMLKDGNERILMCGHHGRKHETGLLMGGFDVEDQTFQLFVNTKPDSSA